MTTVGSISRFDLIRGRLTRDRHQLRPPWSAEQGNFDALCNSSGRCISACPEGILARDEDGLPFVDFSAGACTFCGRCVDVCPSGALHLAHAAPISRPWTAFAEVGADCLGGRGVICRTCQEHCALEAIRFDTALGAGGRPAITNTACTGCGACVSVCPVGAIAVRARPESRSA